MMASATAPAMLPRLRRSGPTYRPTAGRRGAFPATFAAVNGARFRTLAGPVEGELRDRGSRFLARARPVSDRAEAEALFAAETQAFRDATHVVPAFRLHD